MKKYHSTISRRQFLKALGLGGIGLGAANLGTMAIAPQISPLNFNDLDEMISSPVSQYKRPWWVREVDKPTVEIDWDMIKRFDYNEVMWMSGMRKALGPEQVDMVWKRSAKLQREGIEQELPGRKLRDVALNSCSFFCDRSFIGPQTSPAPESLGVPRYEGTPEENARLITTFLRIHGAQHVGFAELDTGTTEKLVYLYDSAHSGFEPNQGPRIDILDVDQPEDHMDEGYLVLPKKARWVIVYTFRMNDESMLRPLTLVGSRATGAMYNLRPLVMAELQNFMRTLGYMCLGQQAAYNGLAQATAFGVLSGLGELSRVGHLITPDFGLMQRVHLCITDLPLTPGKPVNFGVWNFCRTCKKCAENCPPKAIGLTTEPIWDTGNQPFRSPGIKRWMLHEPSCVSYYLSVGNCSLCFGVCPYSHRSNAAIYDLFRSSVASNPSLNRFWRRADDFFYDLGIKDIEKFWELDLPPWGYN